MEMISILFEENTNYIKEEHFTEDTNNVFRLVPACIFLIKIYNNDEK